MEQLYLLKEKRFLPLFITQFFGAFNDNFLKNALIILVTYRSVSVFGLPPTQIVALAGGIFILPFFLFSALAGQVADKFEKGSIIRWIKSAEVGIMFIATLGLLMDNYELLLTALFLMGLHSTFFGPIKYSILPQHLKLPEMVSGNALIEAGTFLAILLGTIAGGVLITVSHGTAVVGGGLLLLAAFGLSSSWFIPKAKPAAPNLKLIWNPFPVTYEILGFARKNKTVFAAILAVSWFWFFGAVMLSIFPALCRDVLHGDEHLVTAVLAFFSIGVGVGSMVTARLSKHKLRLKYVLVGGAGLALFSTGLVVLCSGLPPFKVGTSDFIMSLRGFSILMDLFLFAASGGFFIVPLYTLMQERSERELCSRVIAANNVLNSLFMVVASISLILLYRLNFSIQQILLLHAGLDLVVTIAIAAALPEIFKSKRS